VIINEKEKKLSVSFYVCFIFVISVIILRNNPINCVISNFSHENATINVLFNVVKVTAKLC